MKEVIERRTSHSKTFHLNSNKYQCSTTLGPCHYRDSEKQLQDIDLRCRDDRGAYLMDKAPHTVRVAKNSPSYRYTGQLGTISVELVAINDNPMARRELVREAPTGALRRRESLSWQSIALDTDYQIIPTVSGCATLITLHSANAPRKWRWEIIGDDILSPIVGHDANGYPLELLVTRIGEFLDVTWTGRIYDAKRLRKGARSVLPPAYPVTIDPIVNEVIPSNANDAGSVAGFGSSFQANAANILQGYSTVVGSGWSGFRFTTIAIPQGATITAATLTFDISNTFGSPSSRFYADAADNPGVWATTDRMKNITKTAAFAAFAPIVTTNGFTIGATSVVQEIISRTGWSSNNAMRFAGFNQAGIGADNSAAIAALDHATLTEARLDITYTLSAFIPRAMIF